MGGWGGCNQDKCTQIWFGLLCVVCGSNYVLHTQKHTRLSAFVPCQTLTQHTQTETYSHTQLLTDLTGKEEGNVGFCTHISWWSAVFPAKWTSAHSSSSLRAVITTLKVWMNHSWGFCWALDKHDERLGLFCFLQIICQQNKISAKDESYATNNLLICLQPQLWRQQAPTAHSFHYVDFDCHLLARAWNTGNC